jgi:hypothetical protein
VAADDDSDFLFTPTDTVDVVSEEEDQQQHDHDEDLWEKKRSNTSAKSHVSRDSGYLGESFTFPTAAATALDSALDFAAPAASGEQRLRSQRF